MSFPFEIGDKVVYFHQFSEQETRRWACNPVEKVDNGLVHAFCPSVERSTNAVEARFFILTNKILYLLFEIHSGREY